MQTNPMTYHCGRGGMCAVVCLLLSAMPAVTFAGAFRIFDHSASGTAQGGAFTAQADDPSAIYFNPAGMTQLHGVQVSVGTLLLGGSTSFTGPTGTTTRGDFGGSMAFPPPSNFYITANLKPTGIAALENVTVGIGVVSPFGVLYRYPNDAPFATAVTRQSLPLIDIKPTLAYKLSEQLSVGVGADIYTFAGFWGSGQAETHFISSGGPGLPTFGMPMEINGSDTAAGFNVSLLYTPLRNADGRPLVNLGLVYRSQATLHLDGEFLANGARVANASTTLVLPQVMTGGIALWPVRDAAHEWKVELDVDHTGWKSVRNLDVHLSTGTTIPFPQNWRNSYTVMVGTEYKWLHPAALPDWDVALRGGYWHSQTPIPDQSFTPTVPDADQQAVSAGLGFLCMGHGRFLGLIACGADGESSFGPKAIGLDLAYQLILYEPRTVSGNVQPVAIPGLVNGIYRTTYHVGAINLRVNF
ncbi:putative Porin [Nitrospira moscoviensis]|uniref:Putative Porin n=2 Tax=Nitrospira moscoviensis TaxID=42253 RepID=A0A0K2GB50_NITMO|nr:putative Porin [Nitrospira moscoviensis]